MVQGVRALAMLTMVVLLSGVGTLPAAAQDVPTVPGVPQTGPDVPAVPVDVVEVPVHGAMHWSFTEGWRSNEIAVPDGWDRVFVVLRIWPEGDPWDRLFAVHVGGMEVLHGTTPRTDMTIEKEVTEHGAMLPGGTNVSVGLYLGTWVGAMRSTLTLRFHLTDPVAAALPPADHAVPAFLANWHCGNDLSRTVTFPDEAPSRAIVELYTSGHGSEEFWYQESRWPREFKVSVDGVPFAHVVAMPYVYALLGFYDPEGSLVHGPMWWTAQRALDVAGVHTGVGEIPAYRTTILQPDRLDLLTGERTVTIDNVHLGCSWMTSLNFLLTE